MKFVVSVHRNGVSIQAHSKFLLKLFKAPIDQLPGLKSMCVGPGEKGALRLGIVFH